MSPQDMVAWIGGIGTVAMVLAQFVRVRRDGIEGVSPTTWALFLCSNVFWIGYSHSIGSTPLMAAVILEVPLGIAILARLPRSNVMRSIALAAPVALVALVLPTFAWGWAAGLIGCTIISIALRAPQIQAAIRSRFAHGVSLYTWLLAFANCLLWASYAALTNNDAMLWSNIAICIATLAVVSIVWCKRMRYSAWVAMQERSETQPWLALEPSSRVA
jgi:uncharacterized protein with PQ loop repeat